QRGVRKAQRNKVVDRIYILCSGNPHWKRVRPVSNVRAARQINAHAPAPRKQVIGNGGVPGGLTEKVRRVPYRIEVRHARFVVREDHLPGERHTTRGYTEGPVEPSADPT